MKSLHNCLKAINYCSIKIIIIRLYFVGYWTRKKINNTTKKNILRFWEMSSPPPTRNDDIYILQLPEPDVPSLLVLWESLFFFEEFCLRCSYVPTRDKNHTRTLYIMYKYGVYIYMCIQFRFKTFLRTYKHISLWNIVVSRFLNVYFRSRVSF